MTELHNESSSSSPTRSLVFLVVIGGIVGAFFFLASVEKPPHNMPPGKTHLLRINSSLKLVGLGVEQGLDEKYGIPVVEVAKKRAAKEQLKYHKRTVENRVNLHCARCHGRPGADPTTHPCGTLIGKCLPQAHSPKTECIKCHRQKAKPDEARAPVDRPVLDDALFEEGTAKPNPNAQKPAELAPPTGHAGAAADAGANTGAAQVPVSADGGKEAPAAPSGEGG